MRSARTNTLCHRKLVVNPWVKLLYKKAFYSESPGRIIKRLCWTALWSNQGGGTEEDHLEKNQRRLFKVLKTKDLSERVIKKGVPTCGSSSVGQKTQRQRGQGGK